MRTNWLQSTMQSLQQINTQLQSQPTQDDSFAKNPLGLLSQFSPETGALLELLMHMASAYEQQGQGHQELLGQLPSNVGSFVGRQRVPGMRTPLNHMQRSVGRDGRNIPQDVTQVQRALAQRGADASRFTPGVADENFFQAIEDYQKKEGLQVDGQINLSGETRSSIGNGATTLSRNLFNPSLHHIPAVRGNVLLGRPTGMPTGRPTLGRTSGTNGTDAAATLQTRGASAVNAAQQEWNNEVRENGSTNRSERVDEYALNSGFNYGNKAKGGMWCGFFTEFAVTQAGFNPDSVRINPRTKEAEISRAEPMDGGMRKNPGTLASWQKARDFFMYRSFTKNTPKLNAKFDELREEHKAAGSSRKYFMLEESESIGRIQKRGKYGTKKYADFIENELPNSVFKWQNLPIQGGDVALFHHGHVGLVESYNPETGILTTVEGNTSGMDPNGRKRSGQVVKKTYDLKDPKVRAKFDGFGRASAADYDE